MPNCSLICRLFVVATLSTFLLVAQSSGDEPSDKPRANQVCPLYCYGQWGSVYYYYGCIINTNTYVGATSNRLHELGDCSLNCKDPIKIQMVEHSILENSKSPEKVLVITSDEPVSLQDYVLPAKAGRLGGAAHAASRFYSMNQTVSVKSDDNIKIADRRFRVLGISVPDREELLYIGQEIDPTEVDSEYIEGYSLYVSNGYSNIGSLRFQKDSKTYTADVIGLKSLNK